MYKPLAASTLHSVTKKEIVELLRIAEHNAEASQEWVAQQAENLKDWAPVVHGEWIYHDDGVVTCSECGNAESVESYYCGYCGAKMDGGVDNEVD